MFAPHNPRQNRILAALPPAVRERLFSHLEPVPMSPGDILYESAAPLRHFHFPTTAVVSLLCIAESGTSAETAMVGNEGLLGIAVNMGGEMTPSRAVVEGAGFGYRLDARLLQAEFKQDGTVAHLLLRYTQALINQMSQTAFCTRQHTPDQQFCRRLLQCLDRQPGSGMTLTQEWLSGMPDEQRDAATEMAGKLERAGLLRCNRGQVTVLDRRALERRSCECYGAVKDAFDRLLPPPLTRPAPHDTTTIRASRSIGLVRLPHPPGISARGSLHEHEIGRA